MVTLPPYIDSTLMKSEMSPEILNITRSNFEKCASKSFRDLSSQDEFADVTLVSEDDRQIKAHKVVLGACSSVLKNILVRNHHQHPLIYLIGVKYLELKSLIDFIYLGQTQIAQENLESFMNTALQFQVKGLFDKDKHKPLSTKHLFEDYNFTFQHSKPLLAAFTVYLS